MAEDLVHLQSEEVSTDDKTMALLAHLSFFVLGMIGPALIMILKGKESPFVQYHAMQALIFQCIAFVLIFTVVFCTFGLGFPIAFLFYVPPIIWGIKAYNGEWVGYPGIDGIGLPGAR